MKFILIINKPIYSVQDRFQGHFSLWTILTGAKSINVSQVSRKYKYRKII